MGANALNVNTNQKDINFSLHYHTAEYQIAFLDAEKRQARPVRLNPHCLAFRPVIHTWE